MIVRRPTEADAAAVAELVAALEKHFVGESEVRASDLLDEWRQLELSRDIWLVELDGRLAGYGALFTKRHTFVDINVHPGAWNRGVGSHLLELVETDARRRGIRLLRNGIIDDDQRARAPCFTRAATGSRDTSTGWRSSSTQRRRRRNGRKD